MGQAWWQTSLIPVVKRLEQENQGKPALYSETLSQTNKQPKISK
jgi:hypothetical protein